MVFDEQEVSVEAGFSSTTFGHLNRGHFHGGRSFCLDGQPDRQQCSLVHATAGRSDGTTVGFDDGFADREAQAQAAKLLRDRAFTLFECAKNPRQNIRGDTDAGVLHFDDEFSIGGRELPARPHENLPANGRKLNRVLEQVPKDLRDPGRINSGEMIAPCELRVADDHFLGRFV